MPAKKSPPPERDYHTLVTAAMGHADWLPAAPGELPLPGASPAPYSQMARESADESFIQRVEFALIQDCNANKVLATTPIATDVSLPAQRDRLGRKILADPHAWAIIFARVIAVNLISKNTLLDPAVCTDGDIFSAESSVYDRLLPSL